MHPLVSICIPTYNGARFVRETIESVLRQDYPSLEILISDHSSSDDTLTILRSFPDARIFIKSHPSGGGAESNWNAAISEARGVYVKLMCQDDILKPNCVSQQVLALERFPDCSFCYSLRDILTPKGRRIFKARGFSPKSETMFLENEISRVVNSGTNIFGEPCNVLMRTDCLRQVGPFTGSYLIDLNMWIALWEVGPVVHVAEALAQFRISNSSWTTLLSGKQALEIEARFQSLQKKYPNLISANVLERGLKEARSLERNRRRITWFAEILKL